MTQASPPDNRPSGRSLAVGTAVVAVVLGAVLVGGNLGETPRTGSPGTSPVPPAYTDLPLVVVAPPAPPQATAVLDQSGSVQPSSGASPPRELGIRASRIRIAQRGIDLAIVEGDGIDAPIGKAAHYPGSAWPGGGSNIYIYGHARDGMFITLWNVCVGDAIELDLVDATTRTYVVTQVLPKVPWDAVRYLEPTATEQLTVQTSTSNYPTAPRFIVIAVPTP
jgi:LPXTG-site transpeptidase (sortase) family protein